MVRHFFCKHSPATTAIFIIDILESIDSLRSELGLLQVQLFEGSKEAPEGQRPNEQLI